MNSISDWHTLSQAWPYVCKKPEVELAFKQRPEDFKVTEILPFTPIGEGEHWWLYIKKTRSHTAEVAKALARFVGVSYRDVAYSGLKDYFAETWQWFSVYLPSGKQIEWTKFKLAGAQVIEVCKHNKKLRRRTHCRNAFEIRLNYQAIAQNSQLRGTLENTLKRIKVQGVPNYFGQQRFGRNMSNLDNATAFFQKPGRTSKRLNDRQAMWVSAARAWLFNTVLAERVKDKSWNKLRLHEPCNLNTTQSYFVSSIEDDLETRLANGDIHPTAPMWGVLSSRDHDLFNHAKDCLEIELEYLSGFKELRHGLEGLNLPYKRRTTRCIPSSVRWHFEENSLLLRFELLPGQYATSVLRELTSVS